MSNLIEEVEGFVFRSESSNKYLTPTTIEHFNKLITHIKQQDEKLAAANALLKLVHRDLEDRMRADANDVVSISIVVWKVLKEYDEVNK